MRNLLIVLVLGLLAWQDHSAYATRALSRDVVDDVESSETAELLEQDAASDTRSSYHCDGRVYCSQMTSCDEAEFFLANCPGVKMDGGDDGVPCERQWCGNR